MLALLPLQIRRVGKLRVLEWLASPSNNYGYALYHPDFIAAAPSWLEANWPALMRSIGGVDAVVLRDNPERMEDIANPLTGMFTSRAANRSYVLRLSRDFASLYGRKRDGDTRRTGRKKEKALARLGTVEFGLPQGREATRAVIETMFAQQEGRLAEHGIHNVFGPAERAFIHRIAELQDEDRPVLAPYTLKLNGSVLAIYMGGIYKDTFWALISSLAAGPERKYSPGDIALRHSIERCCEAGLKSYDFSAGSSRYKLSWSDDVIQLHDIIRGMTPAGTAYVAWLRWTSAAKRFVKEDETLMRAAAGLRRVLRGQTPLRPTSD
jgi:CelD/BcsL family acetyltransferase involved in cellulose biosynthesis